MLKLATKQFWPAVFTVAGVVGIAIKSGVVPVEYAGVAATLAALLNAILQHAPKDGAS